MFEFKCTSCGSIHQGMPTFGALAPLHFYGIPDGERKARCVLTADDCVIDGEWFYIRGCVEIPVHGEEEPFVYGLWASVSEESYAEFQRTFHSSRRSQVGPFFGWLNAELALYPSTENLKTLVHLRDDGIRPYIELEPTDHPLALEQRNGISVERVGEIYAYYEALGDKAGR
jgi:hypothetical protein